MVDLECQVAQKQSKIKANDDVAGPVRGRHQIMGPRSNRQTEAVQLRRIFQPLVHSLLQKQSVSPFIGKVPNFEWVLTLNEFRKNLIFSRSKANNGKPFGGRIHTFVFFL